MSQEQTKFVLHNNVHVPATEEEIAAGELTLYVEDEHGEYVQLPPPENTDTQADADAPAESDEEQPKADDDTNVQEQTKPEDTPAVEEKPALPSHEDVQDQAHARIPALADRIATIVEVHEPAGCIPSST
jgi:hypothetical protein